MSSVKSWFKLLPLIMAAILVLAACGGNANTGPNENANAGNNNNSAAPANLLEEIEKAGKIRIGLMGTYKPYNFMNENQQLDGFDVDVAKKVAEHLGVEAVFTTGEFSGLIEGLQQDKFDALVSQVTITEDRKQTMDFSIPYVKNAVNIVVNDDNTTIQSLEDFKGKKIGVGLGTNDEKYLRDVVMPEVGDFEIVTYNDVITSLMDLNTGRIDATINNTFAIQPLIEENHFTIKAVGEPIKEDYPGVALRKGNPELLEAIDNALEEMKEDGSFQEIFQKWFKVDPNI